MTLPRMSAPMQLRDPWSSTLRAALGRCPSCGQGRLFRKFLKVADQCHACGEDLHHHRADDMPAYIVITIVGHIVVPLAFLVEIAYRPEYMIHLLLWMPLLVGLSLLLLPVVKGAIVGLQWALRMHGFDSGTVSGEHDGLLMQPGLRRIDE